MNPGQHIAALALRIYKVLVSPLLHALIGPLGGCRFTPTCSVYAAECVALHGVLKGTVLAVKRICRCHPWGGCGEDPVPSSLKRATSRRLTPPPAAQVCASHVQTQGAAHFGCPPPR